MHGPTTSCQDVHASLGRYVDGELPAQHGEQITAHLQTCARCRGELAALQNLARALAALEPVRVPQEMWPAVEQHLAGGPQLGFPRTSVRTRAARRLRFAAAAAIVLAAGLAGLGLLSEQRRAQAVDVDFEALLDSLSLDVHEAFAQFLRSNDAQASSLSQAREYARELSFDIPAELPGGFRLQQVFTLRVGRGPGVAARYDRDGEFLAAIFHAPVKREDFGSHRDYPCVVGKHRGHMVRVGEWKLIHLADATTCHCVLSRLDEDRDLPAIMVAVAPGAVHGPPDENGSP